MHCTERWITPARLSRPFAAAALSAAWLLLPPAAHAQHQAPSQMQSGPQGQSPQGQAPQRQAPQSQAPQGQAPSSTISDQKLGAAAAAMGQVTSIRQSYEQKVAKAPPSDKQHITDEASNAMKKAVTDQGLSVDEYNSILQTAQNDPALRQRLAQRVNSSGR